MINAAHFPQLKLILWFRPESLLLTEQEAFSTYEANWRYIDEASLQKNEAALIRYLTERYGQGIMNV